MARWRLVNIVRGVTRRNDAVRLVLWSDVPRQHTESIPPWNTFVTQPSIERLFVALGLVSTLVSDSHAK